MSPVPPATSRIDRLELGAPGLRVRTKWSFQRRWVYRDIMSFMVSYFLATEENTSPTNRQKPSLALVTHFFFLFGGNCSEAEVRCLVGLGLRGIISSYAP